MKLDQALEREMIGFIYESEFSMTMMEGVEPHFDCMYKECNPVITKDPSAYPFTPKKLPFIFILTVI